MCYFCCDNKDIWKMRQWYWKNRTKNIFRRDCYINRYYLNVLHELKTTIK